MLLGTVSVTRMIILLYAGSDELDSSFTLDMTAAYIQYSGTEELSASLKSVIRFLNELLTEAPRLHGSAWPSPQVPAKPR